jgi:hypothetical protein
MPRLSQAALNRCASIALAVDEELAKPFDDRKSIYIKTANPRTLKQDLAAYKSLYKREWLTQFWMIVHDSRIRNSRDHGIYGTCVEFSFTEHNRKKIEYEVIRPNEDHIEIFKQDIGEIGLSSFTMTEVSELDDNNAAAYILMESPERMKLDMKYLSDSTKEWLTDQNQTPSPLIKMIQKRGYFIEVRNNYLWITREANNNSQL